jgi:hypothetical protein
MILAWYIFNFDSDSTIIDYLPDRLFSYFLHICTWVYPPQHY